MSTFYIYFWGLICHVGEHKDAETEKSHATLVRSEIDGNGPTHIRKLVFDPNSEVNLGGNVTFRGASRAHVEDDFAAYVISLRDFIGQNTDAKRSVYRKEHDEGYHCEYPPGTRLKVANLYQHLAICRVDDTPKSARLAARIVVAIVETNASELPFEYVDADNQTRSHVLTVANPCVLVANAELASDDKSNHAAHYQRLLIQPRRLQIHDDGKHELQVEFPGTCGWVLEYVQKAEREGRRAASSTECGNSAWP